MSKKNLSCMAAPKNNTLNLLKVFALIILFVCLTIASNVTIAQTNPYYPNSTTPPTIQQTTNKSTGAIELNISAPGTNRIEIFNVYKKVSGVRTLIGSGTLANSANLFISIPHAEITDDMVLEVTSQQPNSSSEFIEWMDTVVYDMCANPNNPFDNYGRLHNEGLDYFFQNRTKGAMSFNEYKAEAFSLISDFYAIANPDNITGSIDDIKEYYYTLEMSNYNAPYDSMFSSPLATYLSNILVENCILNFEDEFTPTTIKPIINAVKNWELTLQRVSNYYPDAIPDNDIKKLWIQSSTLRYSTWYWTNDAASSNGIVNGNYQLLDQIDSLPIDTTGNPTEPEVVDAPFFSKEVWGKILKIAAVAIIDHGTGPVGSAVATVLIEDALKEKSEQQKKEEEATKKAVEDASNDND